MSDTHPGNRLEHQPYVSADTEMREFTVRALLIGVVMAVVLGAAQGYIGLKAGLTIAATYPAAVIGMAVLRIMRGSILEENLARTVGSIGESVTAGAIFTLPAFFIAGVWQKFDTVENYLMASVILLVGGILGVLFVVILRRGMVADVELPFPESVAAAEIHKAGRSTGSGAKFLFGAMGIGALIQLTMLVRLVEATRLWFAGFAGTVIQLGASGSATVRSGIVLTPPSLSPSYLGVGYIIGPKLASLNFSGGLLAWGLFVPVVTYFLGPSLFPTGAEPSSDAWITLSTQVWKNIVRPIAVGGMLMSAAFTLFRMRKSLGAGLKRSFEDATKAAGGEHTTVRTERDLSLVQVLAGLGIVAVATFCIYYYFAQEVVAALVATMVMVLAGFLFAAVSGYLVGIIGSSNNPISGLTVSTLLVAALLLVSLGMKGNAGVAAVLGVAAVVCVAASVSGEMLQDLKVGHILGGTPWKMQAGDLLGAAICSFVMFLPLVVLHQGDIVKGGTGLGGATYSAPQASLMAMLAQGIVRGDMAWPLVIVGIVMGFGFILMQVRSPMIVCVGMYLSLGTTFAIFVGGLIKGVLDRIAAKRSLTSEHKRTVENIGILLAAGLIAGEALIGLLFAGLAIADVQYERWLTDIVAGLPLRYEWSAVLFAFIAWLLIWMPLTHAPGISTNSGTS